MRSSMLERTMERELIFHGTRAKEFDKFELGMLGTGEGCNHANGFYFVSNLKGACYHADYKARQVGKPTVYVCAIKEQAKVVTIGKSISMHPKYLQQHWDKLPVWISTKRGKEWYSELAKPPENRIHNDLIDLNERKRCHILRENGIDILKDFESGQFVDGGYHGRSHLVLNPDSIDIIETLNVEEIYDEIAGRPKFYHLRKEPCIFGKSNILSRLCEYD